MASLLDLASSYPARTLEPGEALIQQGGSGGDLYILESGELSLEQSLAVYERGVGLAREGQTLLDGAQKRVELLVNSSDGPAAVPFAEE